MQQLQNFNNQNNINLISKNISTIFVLIITFQKKIQQLKQKLSSFQQFSPQKAFSMFDKQKGYITSQDIIKKLHPKTILNPLYVSKMIKRFNPQADNANKLTYFSFLNLVKPYFNELLAKDLLSRDTIYNKNRSKNKNSSQLSSQNPFDNINCTQQNRSAYQQFVVQKNNNVEGQVQKSVKQLIRELISIQCIFVTQHQQAKQGFLQHHLMSPYNIQQIIENDLLNKKGQRQNHQRQVRNIKNSLQKVKIFIQNHSQYDVDEDQIKYLLAFCQCHDYVLLSQKYLTLMFMPVNASIPNQNLNINYENNLLQPQKIWKQNKVMNNPQISMPVNHSPQKPSTSKGFQRNFLNYAHPNSIPSIYTTHKQQQRKIQQAEQAKKSQQNMKNLYQKLGIGINGLMNYYQGDQNKGNIASNNNNINNLSHIKENQIPNQKSNLHNVNNNQHQKRNQQENNSRLYISYDKELNLPVLQRFMKQSNIHKNMSRGSQMYPNSRRVQQANLYNQHQLNNQNLFFDLNDFNRRPNNYQQQSKEEQSSAFEQIDSYHNNINPNRYNANNPGNFMKEQNQQINKIKMNYIGSSAQKHQLSLINQHPQLKNILKDKLVINHSQYLRNVKDRQVQSNNLVLQSRNSNKPHVGSNYKHQLLYNQGHHLINLNNQKNQLNHDFYEGSNDYDIVINHTNDNLSKSREIPTLSRKSGYNKSTQGYQNKNKKLQVPINKYYGEQKNLVNSRSSNKSNQNYNGIEIDNVLEQFMVKK